MPPVNNFSGANNAHLIINILSDNDQIVEIFAQKSDSHFKQIKYGASMLNAFIFLQKTTRTYSQSLNDFLQSNTELNSRIGGARTINLVCYDTSQTETERDEWISYIRAHNNNLIIFVGCEKQMLDEYIDYRRFSRNYVHDYFPPEEWPSRDGICNFTATGRNLNEIYERALAQAMQVELFNRAVSQSPIPIPITPTGVPPVGNSTLFNVQPFLRILQALTSTSPNAATRDAASANAATRDVASTSANATTRNVASTSANTPTRNVASAPSSSTLSAQEEKDLEAFQKRFLELPGQLKKLEYNEEESLLIQEFIFKLGTNITSKNEFTSFINGLDAATILEINKVPLDEGVKAVFLDPTTFELPKIPVRIIVSGATTASVYDLASVANFLKRNQPEPITKAPFSIAHVGIDRTTAACLSAMVSAHAEKPLAPDAQNSRSTP